MDQTSGSRTFTASRVETVYHSATAAHSFYFIRHGQVRLYTDGDRGGSRLVEILGPGHWFGVAALAGEATYRMRAVAAAGAVIVEVPVERLWDALRRNPEQLVVLTRQLAFTLLRAHVESSRLVFEDCNQRLISALRRFSESSASTRTEDGVVLRITHDQLAQAVGVARETVSLALTQLRQRGLIRTGRNQLMFDPDALRDASERMRDAGTCELNGVG
jgi:CRP-like cAMP-binding protein